MRRLLLAFFLLLGTAHAQVAEPSIWDADVAAFVDDCTKTADATLAEPSLLQISARPPTGTATFQSTPAPGGIWLTDQDGTIIAFSNTSTDLSAGSANFIWPELAQTVNFHAFYTASCQEKTTKMETWMYKVDALLSGDSAAFGNAVPVANPTSYLPTVTIDYAQKQLTATVDRTGTSCGTNSTIEDCEVPAIFARADVLGPIGASTIYYHEFFGAGAAAPGPFQFSTEIPFLTETLVVCVLAGDTLQCSNHDLGADLVDEVQAQSPATQNGNAFSFDISDEVLKVRPGVDCNGHYAIFLEDTTLGSNVGIGLSQAVNYMVPDNQTTVSAQICCSGDPDIPSLTLNGGLDECSGSFFSTVPDLEQLRADEAQRIIDSMQPPSPPSPPQLPSPPSPPPPPPPPKKDGENVRLDLEQVAVVTVAICLVVAVLLGVGVYFYLKRRAMKGMSQGTVELQPPQSAPPTSPPAKV